MDDSCSFDINHMQEVFEDIIKGKVETTDLKYRNRKIKIRLGTPDSELLETKDLRGQTIGNSTKKHGLP